MADKNKCTNGKIYDSKKKECVDIDVNKKLNKKNEKILLNQKWPKNSWVHKWQESIKDSTKTKE